MTQPTIVWFRNDLRIADNPALAAAHATGAPAIAVHVNAAGTTPERPLGAAASWWLHHSLEALAARLRTLGVPLVLASGDPRHVVPRLAADCGAATVMWNRRYDAAAAAVDDEVRGALAAQETAAATFNGHLLNEPGDVLKADRSPYRVYTPYWKAARAAGGPGPVLPVPPPFPPVTEPTGSEPLERWRLLPQGPDWAARFPDRWQPGEDGARRRLAAFLDSALDGYATGRDRPDLAGTSRLSPHLRFGEISARTVWQAVTARSDAAGVPVDSFLGELGWREFSYHLLGHNPDLATVSFQPKFEHFPWRPADAALARWQQGMTGYPLVDAGMRELWATGWMHNRVRMVTASFLAKHLRIDWRHGEAWFWDTLVDADPANNPAGWQWVAGSGADAMPYFRIFNPVLQGEKFDPDGAYVRRWVPELGALPARWIHKPWQAPARTLADAGVRLGTDYPGPMVDHPAARTAALQALRTLDTADNRALDSIQ